jgi:hypothetical protein
MPAVMIRELDALTEVMEQAPLASQYAVLRDQADMILRSARESIPEPGDLADVVRRYDVLVALHERLTSAGT